MKDQRRSGRSTRMLQYAVQRWRNHMPTILVAHDHKHMKVLSIMLESVLTERDIANMKNHSDRITIIALSDMDTQRHLRYSLLNYNYETNRFSSVEPEVEIVFDHFAMEAHLSKVIAYLNAATHVSNYDNWLLETSRMLSITNKVGLIVAPEHAVYFAEKLEGYDVEVLSDSDNINFVSLSFEAHITASHQLLFHPEYLRRRFASALSTITRFE